MQKLLICFHGTNKKNAYKILKEGFKKGTFFAKHLEDAICFGGKYVFEVVFPNRLPDDWQFYIAKPVKPDKIVSFYKYLKIKIIDNDKLRDKVFESDKN